MLAWGVQIDSSRRVTASHSTTNRQLMVRLLGGRWQECCKDQVLSDCPYRFTARRMRLCLFSLFGRSEEVAGDTWPRIGAELRGRVAGGFNTAGLAESAAIPAWERSLPLRRTTHQWDLGRPNTPLCITAQRRGPCRLQRGAGHIRSRKHNASSQ